MKKYNVSRAVEVNEKFSKTGIRFERTSCSDEFAEKIINDFDSIIEEQKQLKKEYEWKDYIVGYRVTDKQTKKVIFERIERI